MALNLLLPAELFLFLFHAPFLGARFSFLWPVTLLLCAAYCVLLFTLGRADAKGRRVPLSQRIRHALLGSRTIAVLCCAVMVVYLAVAQIFGLPLADPQTKLSAESAKPSEETWTVEEHMDTVLLFREASWHRLSVDEKTAALQVIANLELQRLGVPNEVKLAVRLLPANTYASYDDTNRTVSINADNLAELPPERMLETVCHEIYHAYQSCLIRLYVEAPEELKDLPLLQEAAVYWREMNEYVSGEEDFEAYQAQLCETRAREYASERSGEYAALIASCEAVPS